MSAMPEGWAKTTLGEIASWSSGGTPSRSEPSYYGGDIPWIKSGELNARYVTRTEENITEAGLAGSSAKLFPSGSVAIAMYGATIGKTAILGVDAATNQACAVGIPEIGVSSSTFLYRLLQNEKDAFIAKGKGGAQPNISQAVIKSHEIYLPPLAEQTRIAAKLDELLAQVDTLKARIDGIPALLKRFRQSVLAAAVSGRLTDEWRRPAPSSGADKESSEQLERQDTSAWPTVQLKEVAFDFAYGSSAKSRKQGQVPVLRMGNIQNGRLDWEDLVYTSDAWEITKYSLQHNDILFNRTNSPELVGKTAIYKSEQAAIYAGYLIRVRCTELLNPDFLTYCLNSPQGRHYCWQVKSDGVSQSNINAKKLAAFEFGLPPVEEQTEIVRRVEQLFAFADQLEARVAAAQERIDKLTQSILAKAFRGELVPQDPNDEPASVLLERIKAQRAAAPKAKRGRKAKA